MKKMKTGKRLRILYATVALLPLLGVGSAWAVETTNSAADNPSTVQTTASEAPKTTLADRLAKRKADLATKLTTAQTTRLKARCQAAQTKLTTVNEHAQTASGNRITAYNNIETKLNELVTKLGSDADTTDLQAALATLSTKMDGFEADVTTYKQTLADLLAVDCASDPTSFRASLDSAKTEQAKLTADSAAIRTFLQETIKPLLQTIRSSLETTQTGTTN